MKFTLLLSLLVITANVSGFDQRYTTYHHLLAQYVYGGGVAYEKVAQNRDLISQISSEFESVTKEEFMSWDEKEQISFLINSYNFYTIHLIAENLPLKNGVRDISHPWKKEFVPFLGDTVSLDYVEHDFLRVHYREPRIHFALVCAAIGCPELLDKPFLATELDEMLHHAGLLFLNDTSKNRVEKRVMYLSKIFEWYGDDFKWTHEGGYKEYIREVLQLENRDYRVRFLDYDWGLNSAKGEK